MENEIESCNKKILDFLNRLQNDKVRTKELVDQFNTEIAAIKRKAESAESIEVSQIFEESVEHFKGIAKSLDEWRVEFEKEHSRVQLAFDGLQKNDINEVKKSFQKFILEDMAFSVKNVSMMFYDYERMLESIKAFDTDDV